MEFSWLYDKHMLFMTFIAAGRWNVNIRSSKYVSSFFRRLIQEDDSFMNINIQVATAVASNRQPTEALASVISFTFVVYSHYKHSRYT